MTLSDPFRTFKVTRLLHYAVAVFCAQLTRDLFAIDKFLLL